jgi:hypothetical protein
MKPLSNKELGCVVPAILFLVLFVTLTVVADGGPWWICFIFLAACLLGGREAVWATIEDRFFK